MLPLGRGLAIAKGICRGLAAAHRIGVLHRDLKPENVMVGEDGRPQLMDFGIAIESALYRGDQNETVPGTPQFLAPELLEGEAPGPRTDVYAMGILLYEMFTGRVPFDDNDTAAPRPPRARPRSRRRSRRCARNCRPSCATSSSARSPGIPQSRFPDAAALSDAIAAFEGQVLDRVLAEVSVTRAKMVKLMVILEANKSLAATFDPTETLRIILRTATSETDAERGTIFLDGPAVERARQPDPRGGIRESDPPADRHRHRGHRRRDAARSSTAPTPTAIPGSTSEPTPRRASRPSRSSPRPCGRRPARSWASSRSSTSGGAQFTKEDEEFLAEVASHAALAVAGVREHEAAVRQAREAGAASVLRAVTPLLLPAAWPDVPGFDAAPLRWRSEASSLALYAVAAGAGRLALLLLEHPGGVEESVAPLVRAEGLARRLLDDAPPAEIVRRLASAEPGCSVTAARWEGERLALAARGAPVPYLLRFGRPVPFEIAEKDGVSGVTLETGRGDLLVAASSGLAGMRTPGTPLSTDHAAARLARAAETQTLSAAFATLVAEWKKAGYAPGDRDVLLLAAKRT